uniref:Putative secreted protein n=1 Tax=Xenopsylla cheopis TaxID=163159 RepID=A0A6M2DXM9_XENCH
MLLTRPKYMAGFIPVLAVSLAFIFLVQLKILYDNTQKVNRLNGYKNEAEELTEKMHNLEKSAVRNDNIIQQVASYIRSNAIKKTDMTQGHL